MRSYGMKSKTLVFATLLLAMAFLLMQGIVPHTALAASTWTNTGGGVSSSSIQSLAYDSAHNVLYAGTYKGVWKYDGTTWTDTSGGVSNYCIPSLAYDSVHNLLYAGCWNVSTGTDQGVWKYDGTTWTNTGGGVRNYCISSLAYDSAHNVLYAGTTSNGVWKYDGTTWTNTNGGVSNYYIYSLAYDSVHNILYAGCISNQSTGKWVWACATPNTTPTWTGSANADNYVFSLVYDSVHNILYAGTNGQGVYKYDGKTWTNIGGRLSGCQIYSLAYDSVHNMLYADAGGVWKYNGTTWTSTGGGVSSYAIKSLAYDSGHNLLYAGTEGQGVWEYNTSPSSTFYFAEGYTGTNFQEYLCIGNPNNVQATANVTYMYSDGTTKNAAYKVPANSRYTVNVNSEVGANKDVSIRVLSDTANLVAERPMYFNYNGIWTGGSDAIGATAPNTNWYFAEGNTLPGFDEYITVLNPGASTASLTFHYMVAGTGEKDVGGSVGAHSRATFNTRDQIGSGLNASLYLSSNQAVVAERPMYFNYQGLASNNWTGGHDVVGANFPAKAWYLAEGTTRAGFEEWLTLQNPASSPVTVNATYQLGSGQGAPISKSYTLPAKQRLTVSVNQEIGPNKDDSIQLTSTGSFIAERPMYFSYHGLWTGGHDVLGANNSAKTWFFAEGTTRNNFDEWLCLQNPGSKDAKVTITYYTASGQAINKSWTVSANSRLTVNVNQDVGANQDISAKVSSDNPIIVERPMYFNYNGVWTGGHDVVGFVPQ